MTLAKLIENILEKNADRERQKVTILTDTYRISGCLVDQIRDQRDYLVIKDFKIRSACKQIDFSESYSDEIIISLDKIQAVFLDKETKRSKELTEIMKKNVSGEYTTLP